MSEETKATEEGGDREMFDKLVAQLSAERTTMVERIMGAYEGTDAKEWHTGERLRSMAFETWAITEIVAMIMVARSHRHAIDKALKAVEHVIKAAEHQADINNHITNHIESLYDRVAALAKKVFAS